MPRWTDSDNLVAREARVIGGPYDGLRVAVAERPTMEASTLRWPDVFDLSAYSFDRETWTFRYAEACRCVYPDKCFCDPAAAPA